MSDSCENSLSSPPSLAEESNLDEIHHTVPTPLPFKPSAANPRKCKRRQSSSSYLPPQASRWKRQHAEKLGIYYAKKHCQDLDEIKQKINGKINEFTSDQKEYIEFVLKYLTFQLGMENFSRRDQINSSTAEEEITMVEKNIRKAEIDMSEHASFKGINVSRTSLLAKDRILEFICALRNLLSEMKRCRSENQQYPTAEGFLNGFIASFARLCYLRAIDCSGKPAYYSVWENLDGNHVTSEPDLRLYKYGLNCEFSDTLVTVVKVKTKYNYDPDLMSPPKKKYQGSPRSSPVLPLMSDSEIALFEESEAIELDLHDKVLGQHAGQLLLDLHEKYREKGLKDYEENRKMNMLGMIVEGSTIFFTLLEITWKHYQKLKDNTKLDKDDKATIYYTKSKDILRERDRKILIQNLFSFNNLDLF